MRNLFSFGVLTTIVAAAVMVLCSCSAESTDQGVELRSVAKSQPVHTDTLNVSFDLQHNWSEEEKSAITDTMTVTASITLGEEQGSKAAEETLQAKLSEKNTDYTITANQKHVYATGSKMENRTQYSLSENKFFTIFLNDGNELYVNCHIYSKTMDVYNQTFSLPTLTADSARFAGYVNTPVVTRGIAESYVSEVMETTFYVDLYTHEINVEAPKSFKKRLAISAIRRVLSENGLDTVYVKTLPFDSRIAISETEEVGTFTEVYEYLNGDKKEIIRSFTAPRLFQTRTFADREVNDFAYVWKSNNGYSVGTESYVDSRDGWKLWKRTDGSSARIASSSDVWNTEYSYTIPRYVYEDEYVHVEFPFINVNVAEVNTFVSDVTSDGDYKRATVYNNISTEYLNFSQPLRETLGLYQAEVKIAGYEFKNIYQYVKNGNRYAGLDMLTRYTDRTSTSESYSVVIPWIAKGITNWNVNEENINQNTYGLTNNLVKTTAKKDGNFSYNLYDYSVKNTVALYSSTQTNAWEATLSNELVFTAPDGTTYQYEQIAHTFKDNGALVTLVSKEGKTERYQYTDVLKVTFGEDEKQVTDYGTIIVTEEEVIPDWDPDMPWHFKSMSATCALSTDNSTYVNTLSLHFDEGTLLIIADKDARSLSWSEDNFTSDTNSKLNGGCYRRGNWIHTIATDQSDYMLWSNTENNAVRSLNYITATTMDWNRGNNTVMADYFTYTHEDSVLKIYKDGMLIASYKTAK
jgi:hypothetical protein